jgi:hypothetical protein
VPWLSKSGHQPVGFSAPIGGADRRKTDLLAAIGEAGVKRGTMGVRL